jgi:hypothetical protein
LLGDVIPKDCAIAFADKFDAQIAPAIATARERFR